MVVRYTLNNENVISYRYFLLPSGQQTVDLCYTEKDYTDDIATWLSDSHYTLIAMLALGIILRLVRSLCSKTVYDVATAPGQRYLVANFFGFTLTADEALLTFVYALGQLLTLIANITAPSQQGRAYAFGFVLGNLSM